MDARKPTRPKLTPIAGTPLPSRCASVRRIVPSPPSTTARSASRGSSTIATPLWPASARTRPTASSTSRRPCATTAADLIRCERCCDAFVEVIGKGGVVSLHEVEEELTVALRPRQPGVYDAHDARSPPECCVGDLAHDTLSHLRVAYDASLADVPAPGLELRLDQHARLPAGRREPQHRRKRDPHRDERNVADDQLRREGELGQLARIRLLHHRHAVVGAQLLVQLMRPDVEGDDARSASLEQDVGEAARRRADVDAVEAGGVAAETVEPVRELLAAAGDVWLLPLDGQLDVFFDLSPRLV